MPKSTLQRYLTGETAKIPLSKLGLLAEALCTTPAYIMGWQADSFRLDSIDNIHSIRRHLLPVLGNVVAGEPIWAEEQIDEYVEEVESVRADFALRVKGAAWRRLSRITILSV